MRSSDPSLKESFSPLPRRFLLHSIKAIFSTETAKIKKTKMPKCMVKGCRNRQRKDPGDFSLHTFPKSPTKIKSWLMATGEHFDNVDDFVQQIMEQKKSNTFRICSDHFCPESFANTPVKRYLKYGAVPTRFPKTKGILNFLKLPQKPSVQKMEVDASMFGNSQAAGDAGPATSHQSTSIEIETDDNSHLNGIHDHDYIENLYYELPENDVHSVETNTSVITSNKCISTSNYFGRRNASTQTSDLIISRHARTSTADFFKSKDAWTWTGLSEDLEAVTQTPASKKPGREAKKRRSKNNLDDKEPSPSTSEKAIYESSSTSITTPSSPSIMLMEAPFTPISQMTPPQSCSEVDTYVHEDSMEGDPNCSQDQETTDIGELSFVTQPSPEDIIAEKKFIVFETCLDQLLRVVQRCNFSGSCNAPIREREKTITGTLLSIYTICENNHRCLFWQSQPMIGKRSCGNILASASVLFSGSHFSKVNELFKIFGVLSFPNPCTACIKNSYCFLLSLFIIRKTGGK
uniref:THAP-type domain-containing protein n=1 Tax=Leptobrachium leishanense TaxID=445787 RepID=A0A8C5QPB9_9ANUR